jgi:hypothetical protein
MVVHTCNPSYSGGRDWEDGSLRPSEAKSVRPPSQPTKVSDVCFVSQLHRNITKIAVQTGPGKNARPYSKK